MPKKGEVRPWLMRYEWPNGIKGTMSYRTEADARFAAEQQTKIIGPTGDRCTVTVMHR